MTISNPQVPPQATQTAAQINAAQTGQVKAAVKTARAPEPAKPDTAGWWGLPDVSGSVPSVIRAVEAAPDIPDHWKRAIIEDIKERCGTEYNFVYLDAHFSTGKQGAVFHYHAAPDKKLL